MTPECAAQFEIDHISDRRFSILRAKGALASGSGEEFAESIRLLLAAPHPILIVDLSQAGPRIGTEYLVIAVQAHDVAVQNEKSMTFYVSPGQAARIRKLGLEAALRLVVTRRPRRDDEEKMVGRVSHP